MLGTKNGLCNWGYNGAGYSGADISNGAHCFSWEFEVSAALSKLIPSQAYELGCALVGIIEITVMSPIRSNKSVMFGTGADAGANFKNKNTLIYLA